MRGRAIAPLGESNSPRVNQRGWLVALVAIVCLCNVPRLLLGTVQFDGVDVHYSAQRYLSDELHAGRLPFWTPYVFSGFPFLADLQVGVWYPLNWPFFLAGITPGSIGGELLVHSLIACGGTYALAMRLVGRPAAAVAAAMFYGLSGWFATHSQHVGMFDTAAWLPWLVLLMDHLSEVMPNAAIRPPAVGSRWLSLGPLAVAGLLGAAIALPGHFQVALYAVCGVGVWAALEAGSRRSWSTARRLALGLIAVVVGGGLLSAVMILPALELVSQSVRTRLSASDVDLGYFHPDSLLTLVDPNHYGLLSGHYIGPGDSTQHYFYAGILLLPLAVVGAWRRRGIARTAAFLGLPFLWYALGPVGGLFRLVAPLPGFSSVELPMHGWFLPALGLALLGGAGLSELEARLSRLWTAALVAVIAVDVLTVNQLLNPLAYARSSFDALYGAPLRAFQAEVDAARPPVARLYGQPLTAIGYRNHPLQSRVQTTYGYNPLELAGYADYASAAESNPRLIKGFAASYRLASESGANGIEADIDTLPLAYFARSVVAVADDTSAGGILGTLDPAAATVITRAAPAVQADATPTLFSGGAPTIEPDSAATVSVIARKMDEVTIHYVTKTRGLIRVAIPSYPGWRARLDNTDLPLVTVDRAFIGVVVPPGEGDVQLSYTPRFFVSGAAISLAALAVALVALVACRVSTIAGGRSTAITREHVSSRDV